MAKFIEEVVAAGFVTVNFTRNTPYNGVDYGPDYDEQIAVVESRQAAIWMSRGRCVEVNDETEMIPVDEPISILAPIPAVEPIPAEPLTTELPIVETAPKKAKK